MKKLIGQALFDAYNQNDSTTSRHLDQHGIVVLCFNKNEDGTSVIFHLVIGGKVVCIIVDELGKTADCYIKMIRDPFLIKVIKQFIILEFDFKHIDHEYYDYVSESDMRWLALSKNK